jgi:NAD+-dependent secondary alcohol dehydrogenase Adh1
MKAIRIHNYKQPPQLDEVRQPDLGAADDVILRVGGSGVCRTDLHLIDGWFDDVMPPTRPFTLGHETAGWIEAVGPAVKNVHVGDAVIVHPLRACGVCSACRNGEDMYCADSIFPGVNADGGYAEYLLTSARSVVPLANGTSPADVAPYADAGLTAYRAVKKAAKTLKPGQTVVVLGAGGLGHIGIQLLREMAPASILAIDPSPAARDLALESGADEVFNLEDAIAGTLEATEGRGADVVVDFVGEGDAPAQAIELVRQGGAYYIVGYGGELRVQTMLLILKEVTIAGNLVGSYSDLAELMALVTAGRIKLETTTYPLEQAVQALDDLSGGRVKGRAVLTPNRA